MRIVPVSQQYIEWLRQQRNRPELMKYFRQNEDITFKQQQIWWDNLNKGNSKLFIVLKDEYAIGYVGLNPIDWRHKHAEFGIFIIPEAQGDGYGKQALMELLNYGFNELKLHKIYSDVLDYSEENKFKFYKDLGFKQDGVNFQHYFKNGVWIDSISFSILEEEYRRIYDKSNKSNLGLREVSSYSESKKER